MGGCASRPKDLNFSQDSLPAEGPTTPKPIVKDVQDEVAAAQENDNGGESQKEEPLVDLSESNDLPEAPKSDGDAPESETAIADLVSGITEPSDVNHETAKQIEDNVGSEAANDTTEQTKDGQEVEEVADKPDVVTAL
ncbi:hypothetical protein NE237_011593 [Protea cynaroides]|uniref:Uncharacterized protein n=1 Tax=Protea cynaroides TaxID=273540 RepID=A0A9Q0GWF1_9MAGN|nr:hypothetical protein NE237_011593 [Protea cynaroides]